MADFDDDVAAAAAEEEATPFGSVASKATEAVAEPEMVGVGRLVWSSLLPFLDAMVFPEMDAVKETKTSRRGPGN